MKQEIPVNSPKAWLLASRPKTLSAALVGVCVAAALAVALTPYIYIGIGALRWGAWGWCVAFAALMQIDSNLINDYFDFRRGRDGAQRLGPQRAMASGWITPRAMEWGIALCTLAACASGLLLLLCVEEAWWFVLVGAACVAGAFLYTLGGSTSGLGDVMVVMFFGIVPTVCTFYALTGALCGAVWSVGLAVGFAIDPLLILNNYRDREEDAAAGKRTLVVILGERVGLFSYLLCGCVAVAVMAVSLNATAPWVWWLLLCIYLPFHLHAFFTMRRIGSGSALNRVLALTSRNIILFTLCVVVGACL